MKNFRTYQLSLQLYRQSKSLKLKSPVKDQFERAILSVVLNLAEGSGKIGEKERRRFFSISFGSLKEVQACLEIIEAKELSAQADQVAASLYRLIQNPGPGPLA